MLTAPIQGIARYTPDEIRGTRRGGPAYVAAKFLGEITFLGTDPADALTRRSPWNDYPGLSASRRCIPVLTHRRREASRTS